MRSAPHRRTALTIGWCALAVAVAGCLRLPADNPPEPSAPVPSGEQHSLEGAFTYDQMDSYVNAVYPMITDWADRTWRQLPRPRQVVYVPRGASGPEGCAEPDGSAGRYTSSSYEYCGADQVIYLGQDLLWEFYTETGDAGPAVGLAHEFGHYIQDETGVPEPGTAAESIRHEDQADCLAGAWTQYTDQVGLLEYPDDLEDIDALFPIIGSAEGPQRDHGTAGERARAFNTGFRGGAEACNAFYPDTPVAA